MIGLSFSAEAPLKDLQQDGGVEEFAKRAREMLEEALKPLQALEMMKKVTKKN